ncbi:hypothetical protein LZZ85_21960 [Terrimonas sp. NA20]|uniref:Uncharacterized protein n=1 Tax=Terrimonas ginsenosidimutans TaxID=2908004 RepID=A0ABS9KXG6_9BACT|nr:hypothetical protein [Terrimonas ginsenosidimutans]MCG2616978.1 hypothetical protein [Terrimonas ginsenosidimutans]
MSPNWQSAKKRMLEFMLPILLGLATSLLLLFYIFKLGFSTFFISHADGFKEMFGIALAILSSGIFLAVLKWFQFMGFFKEEMHKIVKSSQFNEQLQDSFNNVLYSDEFLQNRSDIEDIWKRVTRCYFKSEFPHEVSDKINEKLSNIFFHNNNISHFFRTCIMTINVSLDEHGFLSIEEITESKMIRNNTDPFQYDFCYYVKRLSETDQKSFIEIYHFSVDGKTMDLASITKNETTVNRIQEKLDVKLEGKKEYNLVIKSRLTYNIDLDNIYTHYNQRAVEYMRVEINYSANLSTYFLPIGNEKFTGEAVGQKLIKVYNDLLLPEKGFNLIFIKN